MERPNKHKTNKMTQYPLIPLMPIHKIILIMMALIVIAAIITGLIKKTKDQIKKKQ